MDTARYDKLAALMHARPHEEVTYAKAATLVCRAEQDAIIAVSPGPRVLVIGNLSEFSQANGVNLERWSAFELFRRGVETLK